MQKLFALAVFMLLLCFAPLAFGQSSRTFYYDAHGKPTRSANAYRFSTVIPHQSDPTLVLVETFSKAGIRISSGYYKVQSMSVNWEKLHEPTFTDAWKDGQYTEYYENGGLKFQGNFENGKGEGKHNRYYENGQLLSETALKAGSGHGKVTTYYENGQLKMAYSLIDGVLKGELIEYFENGKKKKKITFQDGKATGEPIEYDAEEKPIERPGY